MSRMRKVLFGLCALVLLSWMSNAVENALAHPSGHPHKHILSHSNGQKHIDDNAVAVEFNCPSHKHGSLLPCPHKHSQKEMAYPEQNKIGPDCGESPVKSVFPNTGSDYNSVLTVDMSRPDLPARAFLPFAGCL